MQSSNGYSIGNWLIFNAKISRANPGRSKAIYRPSFLIWNILFTFYEKWKHSRFCACAAVFIWSKLILLGRLQIFLSLFFQVDSSYSYYPAWTASWPVLFITKKLVWQKGHNLLSNFLFSKKFRRYPILLLAFYLIMWHMKSPKSFEKIAILKIWKLVFFLGFKTYFGIPTLKWCIFRHEKNRFSL